MSLSSLAYNSGGNVILLTCHVLVLLCCCTHYDWTVDEIVLLTHRTR